MPFEDGHTRQLPRLVAGPFRHATYASTYLAAAKRLTTLPVKQAVISASALSLLYPNSEIPGYPRAAFLSDLVDEAVSDIRTCLDYGAERADRLHGRAPLAQTRSRPTEARPSGGIAYSYVSRSRSVIPFSAPSWRCPDAVTARNDQA